HLDAAGLAVVTGAALVGSAAAVALEPAFLVGARFVLVDRNAQLVGCGAGVRFLQAAHFVVVAVAALEHLAAAVRDGAALGVEVVAGLRGTLAGRDPAAAAAERDDDGAGSAFTGVRCAAVSGRSLGPSLGEPSLVGRNARIAAACGEPQKDKNTDSPKAGSVHSHSKCYLRLRSGLVCSSPTQLMNHAESGLG